MRAPIIGAAIIDKARAVPIEVELARRGFPFWTKALHNNLGQPCPMCGGDDRFSVNTKTQLWNCRKCGLGGDVIDLVRTLDGADFETAVATLTGPLPPFKPNGQAKAVRTTSYDYRDASGMVRYHKKRFDRANGNKFFGFYQLDGTKGRGLSEPLLYGAEHLADLREGQPVWIVEGEKKVERMRELGAIAVSGDSGAQSRWLPEHAELLRGSPVILWPDSDEPGEKYIANAAAAVRAVDPAADLRVVRPFGPPDGAKGRDVCDWNGDEAALADLAAGAIAYARLTPSNGETAPAAPFARIINPADWEGVPIPEREWIVRDYIPHKTVTMLSGDGGQGKSLLALQLAAGRALAKEWIGLLPTPGRTLVLSAEDDGDEMHRRLDKIRAFHNAAWADLADIRLVDLAGENSVLGALVKGQIEPTDMYHTLDAYMAAFKASLTALDVLADMFAGQENDRA